MVSYELKKSKGAADSWALKERSEDGKVLFPFKARHSSSLM